MPDNIIDFQFTSPCIPTFLPSGVSKISSKAEWACVATGDTPLLCHRISFIPLKLSGVASHSQQRGETPWKHTGPLSGVADSAAPGAGDSGDGDCPEADVHVRFQTGDGDEERVTSARMESIECGGALLSLCVSRDDRLVIANVRPFTVRASEECVRGEERMR